MNFIEKITDFLSRMFLILPAIGLVASLDAHLLSIVNIRLPFAPDVVATLCLSSFVFMVPTGLLMTVQTSGVEREGWWNVIYTGCPRWMRRLQNGLFIYFLVNFILLILFGPSKQQQLQFPMSPIEARMATSFTMLAFGTAFATYYSFLHRDIKGD